MAEWSVWALTACVVMGGATTMRSDAAAHEAGILTRDDMEFLEQLTADVLEESRVGPGQRVGSIGPNVTGGTVIRPGGRNCYPAFWIRDYAMSLDSGLVMEEEQRHMLFLTARHQQDEDWPLPSGSVVTAGSIADHVSFGDKPIYYPGVLDDYDGQGGPRWGKLPCLDDAFLFIHMAFWYGKSTGDYAFLEEEVAGTPLMRRLEEAYAMPPSREASGLVFATNEERGVSFGFVDTTIHTGDLLFCSLLKYRAANELSLLAGRLGRAREAKRWHEEAQRLRKAINRTFALPNGLLRASTGTSGQPDVWGTAFAVYVGALKRGNQRRACAALAQGYRDGTIAWRGNIRHVPTTADFSDESAWESTDVAKNRYQNGAYWGTPAGWVAYAIAQEDRALAADLAREYVAELREGDYRKGDEYGSPWECFHPDGNHRQNPVYLTSVTCPLAAFRRFAEELPLR